jgi:polyphosphate kinase
VNAISQGLEESEKTVNLLDSRYYLNRELSWLHFNDRVLHEASDPRTPLLERLKFAAIFSSNLDEFFMVRISGLMEQIEAGVYPQNPDGFSPKAQLKVLREHLLGKVEEQYHLFEFELRPALAEAGIHLLDYPDMGTEQRIVVKNYFEDHVFPVLTPLSVDPAHPFPQMSNLSLNLAVIVEDPETGMERFARIKVPDSLPRFVTLSDDRNSKDELRPTWIGLPLEQVIAQHLDRLFPGMSIKTHYLFRITRDADFPVKEDEADDLLAAIAEEVNKRRLDGFVCRLEIERSMHPDEREKLIKALEITENAVYEIEGLLNLKDLFFFMGLPFPALMDPPWIPVVPGRFKQFRPAEANDSAQNEFPGAIFEEIRKGDLLVHHPYESFGATVLEFIVQAAEDPQVMAIKLTLYRTSGDSPIVSALISAAENGKHVIVQCHRRERV